MSTNLETKIEEFVESISCKLFATKSFDDMEEYLSRFSGQEQVIARVIYGITLNTIGAELRSLMQSSEIPNAY